MRATSYANKLKIFLARMFGGLVINSVVCTTMMTIADFAKKREISAATVYSWIYRNQAEKNGFMVHQIGKVKLIEELKKKK